MIFEVKMLAIIHLTDNHKWISILQYNIFNYNDTGRAFSVEVMDKKPFKMFRD